MYCRLLLFFVIFCCLRTSGQVSASKELRVSSVIHELPDSIRVSKHFLNAIFQLKTGDTVRLAATPHSSLVFIIRDRMESSTRTSLNLVEATSPHLLFTISAINSTADTIDYSGRIVSRKLDNALLLFQDGQSYQFNRIELNKILAE